MDNLILDEKMLFETLANIARSFPMVLKGLEPHQYNVPCLRINSFAFVKSLDDLSADNLNKDIRYAQKNIIFSREWENKGKKASQLSFQFPMLLIAASDHEYKGIGKGSMVSKCKKFNLMVVDKMPGKYGDCCDDYHYCSERCEEEVMCDIESLMSTALTNLMQHGFYEFFDLAGESVGSSIAHPAEAQQCADDDENISSFKCHKKLDKLITVGKSGTFLSQTAKNLAITTTTIEICFPCPETLPLTYAKVSVDVLPDGCCEPKPLS